MPELTGVAIVRSIVAYPEGQTETLEISVPYGFDGLDELVRAARTLHERGEQPADPST